MTSIVLLLLMPGLAMLALVVLGALLSWKQRHRAGAGLQFLVLPIPFESSGRKQSQMIKNLREAAEQAMRTQPSSDAHEIQIAAQEVMESPSDENLLRLRALQIVLRRKHRL